MFVRSLLAHQLGHPSGVLGRLMGRPLNRINARVNAAALERLALRPSDHLLDVGFGGGLMLRAALDALPAGAVAGVEISDPMIARARRLFRREIAQGRCEIRSGEAAAIPYADARFDKACAINTLHFWPDPSAGCRDVFRVLKPGGRFVLALRPKDYLERIAFTEHGFRAYEPDELTSLLQNADFEHVRVETRADRDMGMMLAVASKPETPAAG